jgi:GNAT superfamily N-acetyltransferase
MDRATLEFVEAFLIEEVSKEQVLAAHGAWQPYREKALRRLRQQKTLWPEHWHWNWAQKAGKLDFLAYRCIGIEQGDEMQGLMMLSTVHRPSRLREQEGKPTLYIEYIESAPWNLAVLAESPKFSGIGTRLVEAAVEFSVQEGCAGRLALHSLPQSETFYRRYMTEVAVDPVAGASLTYFEMTADQAAEFLGGRNP